MWKMLERVCDHLFWELANLDLNVPEKLTKKVWEKVEKITWSTCQLVSIPKSLRDFARETEKDELRKRWLWKKVNLDVWNHL